MDRAIDMVESPENIKRCEMLMLNVFYKGCYPLYFKVYENDDTLLTATLSDRFDRAMAYMKKWGFNLSEDVSKYVSVDNRICEFHYDSIHSAAWLDWIESWDELCTDHTKPIPEEYVTIGPKL